MAHILAEIAALMELNGRDSFRARAFRTAARTLDGLDADLRQLTAEDRLASLRGIGPAIAAVISEYVRTGRSRLHDELSAATPPGLYDLMRVGGLGTKRIHLLHSQLGIAGLDDLERAARAGRIADLPGFGERTQAKILEGIPFARSTRQRRRYPEALEAAARLVDWLRSLPATGDAFIAGALRRRLEVVDAIDIVAQTDDAHQVLSHFRQLGPPVEAPQGDDEETIRLSDGLFVHLRCVSRARLAYALLWETGSPEHLETLRHRAEERGARMDRDGLWIRGRRRSIRTEESLYELLGFAFVPPEQREPGIPLPEQGVETIELVRTGDLRGTFHCHSTYSDGKATLVEMAESARARGWTYLGIADHSRSATYAGGMQVTKLRQQLREIDAINEEYAAAGVSFRLFSGVEADILHDGRLDYPPEVLAGLDYVVGSVHGALGMNESEMTRRIVTAIHNPALTILGHPTGRLLLTREGYPLDVRAVLEAAADAGVVIEINANPHRLDLDWRDVRIAAKLGILIAVNPDAHSVTALDHVAYGINMARKAGLSREQVLNTWSSDDVARYFAERKR